MKRALQFFVATVLIASFVLLSACSSNQTGEVNDNQNLQQANDNNAMNNSAVDNDSDNTVSNNTENQADNLQALDDGEPAAITLVDDLGTEITLEGPAQRVIGLAPSVIELLFAVGAGDQVVGREEFTNYPEEAVDIPSVGGNFGELNTEAIVALEPDLVLVANLTTPEQIASLEELGLTVFQLPNPTDLDGMYDSLRTVATLTGHEAEAEELIVSLQARVQAVVDVIADAKDAPLVFYELDSTDPNAPWTSGPGTFIDTLITMAGGMNVGAVFDGAWVQISSEELIAQNPEIIVLGDSIWGVTVEDVVARPGYAAIAAVQNGQVFPFNDDLASRPGPRLVDGLEELARIIHPELFN